MSEQTDCPKCGADTPTCDAAYHDVAPLPASPRPAMGRWLKCPHCGHRWDSGELGIVDWTACPSCRGSFSFAGPHLTDPPAEPRPEESEVLRLLRKLSPATVEAVEREIVAEPRPDEETPTVEQCPKCGRFDNQGVSADPPQEP